MMQRRAFLATLGAAIAGATFDPERLLWVPGAKTFFIPPIHGWSADTDLFVMREALKILRNNIQFRTLVSRDYEFRFGPVLGGAVSVSLPARFAGAR